MRVCFPPSMIGLASRIWCSIHECCPLMAARNCRINLVDSVLPAPLSPLKCQNRNEWLRAFPKIRRTKKNECDELRRHSIGSSIIKCRDKHSYNKAVPPDFTYENWYANWELRNFIWELRLILNWQFCGFSRRVTIHTMTCNRQIYCIPHVNKEVWHDIACHLTRYCLHFSY